MKRKFKITKTKNKINAQKPADKKQEEEVGLNENIKETTPLPKNKFNRKVLQILGIIVVCVLLVVIWMGFKHGDLLSMFSSSHFSQNIQGTYVEKGNFQLMGDGVASTSDTSFTYLNKNGKQQNNDLHSFNDPAMDTDGSWAIIYNKNGKDFQVEHNSSQVTKKTVDNAIICAAISQSGTYAMVTKSNNYVADLYVYNLEGNEKYKYHFAENYVTDIAINKEGSKAVVSCVQTDDGTMKSVIYVINFSKEKEEAKIDLKDNMVLKVDYMYDDTPVAVGEKYTSFINSSKGSKTDFNYENKNVANYSINPEFGVALALSSSEDGHNCNCVVLGENCEKKADFQTDLAVESIYAKNNTVAVLAQGEVYVYNLKGNNSSKVQVGTDASKILLSDPKSCYVLGISEIKKIKL